DEIAELPLSMQVKLLRAVQEKKIRPVGSDQEIDVDFRVISASHQDLDLLVQQGKFRQDLFFRIHVMDIMLPPLRDRGGDILLLANHFIQKVCTE
ncbi:sigma 54-interacting transcriptional regulator, partial [Acinetobacter baumannii]